MRRYQAGVGASALNALHEFQELPQTNYAEKLKVCGLIWSSDQIRKISVAK